MPDPISHRRQARLLSLTIQNGLARMSAQLPERPATCKRPPAPVVPNIPLMINTTTSHSKKHTIMNTTKESSADDRIETDRGIIRQSLGEIVAEVGVALRHAGLISPVYLCIPLSGDALVTLATPVDPSDDDWSLATEIVKQIISKKLDGIGLRSHDLQCAIASATMGAAEITRD